MNFLELSRKFLMAVLGHHTAAIPLFSVYFFLAFELNITLRISMLLLLRTILALPVVDPGGPSVSLFWTWFGFWGQRRVGSP